jgi:hypothetical protein
MKEIRLPGETVTLLDEALGKERTHTALEVIEDAVMGRAAWRSGHGPKNAAIVFAAFDKAIQGDDGSVRFRLPDGVYTFMLEQVALDPQSRITPRAANRYYLKIARAFADAEEFEEETNGAVKKSAIAADRGA